MTSENIVVNHVLVVFFLLAAFSSFSVSRYQSVVNIHLFIGDSCFALAAKRLGLARFRWCRWFRSTFQSAGFFFRFFFLRFFFFVFFSAFFFLRFFFLRFLNADVCRFRSAKCYGVWQMHVLCRNVEKYELFLNQMRLFSFFIGGILNAKQMLCNINADA